MARMPNGYRWTIREIDPKLVRRLRILALQRNTTVSALLTEALRPYLEREEARQQEKQNPQSPDLGKPE